MPLPKNKKEAKRPNAAEFFEAAQNPPDPLLAREESMVEKTQGELLLTVSEILKKGRAEDDFETEVVRQLRTRMANGDVEEMPTFALVKLYEIIKKSKTDFTDSVLGAIKASAEKRGGTDAESKLLAGRRVFLRDGNGQEQSYSKDQVQSANNILNVLERLTGSEIPEDIKNQLHDMESQLGEPE